jgi:hypothetical protein
VNITTFDNITTSQVGEVLRSLLSDERWDQLEVAVAFLKTSGIIRIEQDLARFIQRGGSAQFIKNSTEYPSACWRDESGSPIGEAKVFAVSGQILV